VAGKKGRKATKTGQPQTVPAGPPNKALVSAGRKRYYFLYGCGISVLLSF